MSDQIKNKSRFSTLGPPPIPELELQALEDFHQLLGAPIALFRDCYNTHFRSIINYLNENHSRIFGNLIQQKMGVGDIYGDPPEIFSGVALIAEGHIISLIIHGGNLTKIPPSIGNITNLVQLYLQYNNLTTLPEELRQLTRLQSLELDYNCLSRLPEGLGQLRRLDRLSLRHNSLVALPESLSEMSMLQGIDLVDNAFTEFPEVLTRLPSLIGIDLSKNHIKVIPPSINRLRNLQGLGFDFNELISLPNPFGPFPQLQGLGLRNNWLESFPEWIGPYSQRKIHIRLSNNRIHTIPAFVRQITFLETLLLDNNPLDPPYDFIANRARQIKTPYSHPHNIIPPPPQIYFIKHMVGLWEDFSNNLIALLSANRLPGNWFHQLILHSSAGGFVLQKCAEIPTPAARQYALMLSDDYHRTSFGDYNIYGPI